MTQLQLAPLPGYHAFAGPVVLVIMDGVGLGKRDESDGVFLANTPVLDELLAEPLFAQLKAHGKAVGLPSDEDMGNSEVGHNALGAGPRVRAGRAAGERGDRRRAASSGGGMAGGDRRAATRAARSTSSACSRTATSTATSRTCSRCSDRCADGGRRRACASTRCSTAATWASGAR